LKRIERKSKPKKCPQCGHSPVGKILWGMPRMTDLQKDLLSSRFFCAFLNPEDRRICREVVNRFLGTDAWK